MTVRLLKTVKTHYIKLTEGGVQQPHSPLDLTLDFSPLTSSNCVLLLSERLHDSVSCCRQREVITSRHQCHEQIMSCGFESLNCLCVKEMLPADLSWIQIFQFPLPVFLRQSLTSFIMKGGLLYCRGCLHCVHTTQYIIIFLLYDCLTKLFSSLIIVSCQQTRTND